MELDFEDPEMLSDYQDYAQRHESGLIDPDPETGEVPELISFDEYKEFFG